MSTLLFRVLDYNLGRPEPFPVSHVYILGIFYIYFVLNFMLTIQITDRVSKTADHFAMSINQFCYLNDTSDDLQDFVSKCCKHFIMVLLLIK